MLNYATSSQLKKSSLLIRSFYSKITTIENAISKISPNSVVLAGGFGLCGNPESLFEEIMHQQIGNLTVLSNSVGSNNYGLGPLVKANLVTSVITSYIADCPVFRDMYLKGMVELHPTPQGTLVEMVRCAGKGLPAFLTPTGVGTMVEYGGFPVKYVQGGGDVEVLSTPKPTMVIKGRKYIKEKSVFADFAIIKAYKADRTGNLVFHQTARNFNQDMATAAKIVIAEVEQIVDSDELDPDQIHVPGIFVDYICLTKERPEDKPIEKLVYDDGVGNSRVENVKMTSQRTTIARRIAKELNDGDYVNLGIGIPTLVPSFLGKDKDVVIHSENGLLGLGGYPIKGQENADLINASKEAATIRPGASYFSSSDSFGIIRGGHLDWTILGGFQVSAEGDLANWYVPGKLLKGMGGAMDLVSSGSKVAVAMEHLDKSGKSKIKEKCTLPLTGTKCVSLLVTDMAVFDFKSGRLTLKDVAEGLTVDDVKKHTDCKFECYSELGSF